MDRRIWHYEHNGKFSVWSVYYVVQALVYSEGEDASVSTSLPDDRRDKFWRKLWNACVLGKVMICAWCACMEALPTKSNLARR